MRDRLITLVGGGGFLGRYIAQELLATGARIRIAQRDPRQAFFLKPLGGLGQTQFVAADIRKPDSLARAFEGADSVVNLVGVRRGDYRGLHVVGAANAARAAAAAGVGSFVHVSSAGADSEAPSEYSRSKAAGEDAVRDAFPNAVIVRPSILFGRESSFINMLAGMIATLPVVPVVRPGWRCQPVYVADVAAAIVRILADPAAFAGRVPEFGGPDILAMRDLVAAIAKATGREPWTVELPDVAGSLLAMFGFLPGSPLSRQEWLALQHDNLPQGGTEGLAALGIAPTPFSAVAPSWLVRYRRHGRFGTRAAA
jgi:uncharacterized protein YbjT (DUF2867 family)